MFPLYALHQKCFCSVLSYILWDNFFGRIGLGLMWNRSYIHIDKLLSFGFIQMHLPYSITCKLKVNSRLDFVAPSLLSCFEKHSDFIALPCMFKICIN